MQIADGRVAPIEVLAAADVITVTGRGLGAAHLRDLEGVARSLARWCAPDEPAGVIDGSVRVPYLDDEAMADSIVALAADGPPSASSARAEAIRARHDLDRTGARLMAFAADPQ